MLDNPSGTKSDLPEEARRRYVEALETLPPLTRAVFLLKRLDDLSYDDIGGRCGITVNEVTVRMTDALIGVDRYMEGQPAMAARVRRASLPWRDAWARARMRESDRRLAPWLAPEKRPGSRSVLEWVAWIFEHVMR
jgi:hypothetical protein